MSAPKYQLGQRVRYADTIKRTYQFDREHPVRHANWVRRGTYPGRPQPGEGILVGLRTFQDGHTSGHYDGPESWTAFYNFERTANHRVAVIATALHLKPVFAFLEDVEAINE